MKMLPSLLAQMTPQERAAALKKTGAHYVLTPNPEKAPVFDFRQFGDVAVDGSAFQLIKLR